MARVLRFYTATFDPSTERPNPINPIPGESLLLWLRERAKGTVEVSEPDAEDWGWYSSVEWKGRAYVLGASASEEEESGEREWVLQIDEHRSVKEKFLGRATMGADDECARYFQRLIENEASFRGVTVDPER